MSLIPEFLGQTIGPDDEVGIATMSFSIVNTENLLDWGDENDYKVWEVNPGSDVTLTALPVDDRCELAFSEWKNV